VKRVREAGLGDMFPSLIQEDYNTIMTDGKIPNYNRWASRIATGELAPDTMLNLAGLASFTQDQMALDSRIKKLITA
ncbi:MAG: transaldolase, partial [Bacteroidales bacterium]|nr:transaldolase [Bacteroidales bacterium]